MGEVKWFRTDIRRDDPDYQTLRSFCDANGIYYEPSDAGYGYTHFEIKCDKKTADRINREVFHE